jgi:hypothetical protein
MRRLLVPAALVLGLSLGAIALAQEASPRQAATPRPEGSPSASPAASPAVCPEDTLPGRLVAVPNEVTILLTDEGFDPGTIQTTNNADLTLTLFNTGTRAHSFVLKDLGVNVEISPGDSETLVLRPEDGGDAVTYPFYSDEPGDMCMRGALVFYI